MIERTVHLLQDRTYDPARAVEVERDGTWFPALQHSWQLWDDGRGWMADVEWTECHYWGTRTVGAMVPAERVRLAGARNAPSSVWTPSDELLPTAV